MNDAAPSAAPPRPAVLVTGAAKRLGAAIARAFDAAGWAVLVHHNGSTAEAAALARTLGEAHLLRFDLADPAAIGQGLDQAFALAPGLACLVNSASRFQADEAGAPSPQVWAEALSVNALAPVLLAAGFHRRLAGREGSVVNLLDQKLKNLNPDYFSYTVSKAALDAASQLMARAFAPNLRVANVAPGLILPSGDQTEAEFEQAARMNLLRRRTRPEEVAAAVLHIAQSPWLTGQTLFVDSGQSLTAQPRDVMFLVRGEN